MEDSENGERSSSVKRGSVAGYDDDDDGMYVCMYDGGRLRREDAATRGFILGHQDGGLIAFHVLGLYAKLIVIQDRGVRCLGGGGGGAVQVRWTPEDENDGSGGAQREVYVSSKYLRTKKPVTKLTGT